MDNVRIFASRTEREQDLLLPVTYSEAFPIEPSRSMPLSQAVSLRFGLTEVSEDASHYEPDSYDMARYVFDIYPFLCFDADLTSAVVSSAGPMVTYHGDLVFDDEPVNLPTGQQRALRAYMHDTGMAYAVPVGRISSPLLLLIATKPPVSAAPDN
jgi:hypothetical protein